MSLAILEDINDIPEGLDVIDNFSKNEYIIAKAITDNKKSYVKLADNKHKEIVSLNKNTRFEPVIPYKKIERWLCMIFGASGKGKTLIAGEFARQYAKINGGKIYYICSTPIEDDRTFSEMTDIVKQVDVHQFYNKDMSKDDIREMIRSLFSNSLTIFDDNDGAKDEKTIREFRDLLVEVGRKYHASLLFISHKNCDAHKTKMLLNELTLYICFKKNLINNRLLTEYYGFEEEYLKNINTKSFACFNFAYDKVICPYEIKDFNLEVMKEKNPKKNLAKQKHKDIKEELKQLDLIRQKTRCEESKEKLNDILDSLKGKGY